MTLHPETIARVRGHIARNLRLGQSWDDMRRNANASAARLGAEIAATITSPSEANDKRLAELFERAADMRAQYAALLATGQGVPCSVAELPRGFCQWYCRAGCTGSVAVRHGFR
jgi:hypothetical protein